MVDLDDLKRKAEAAQNPDDLRAACALGAALPPETVLTLIAEIERLRAAAGESPYAHCANGSFMER